MSTHDTDAPAGGAPTAPGTSHLQPIGANELRLLTIPRRMFGYDRRDVDEALDRAAQTIDDLVRRAQGHRGELDELTEKLFTLQSALERNTSATSLSQAPASDTTPEPHRTEAAVGDVLARAHSLAEKHVQKAREDAAGIVSQAHAHAAAILTETSGERDRLARLLHAAEQEVEQARFYAKTMLEKGKSDHDRRLEDALGEAEERLAELRGESARLEARIEELRRGSSRAAVGDPAGPAVAPAGDGQGGIPEPGASEEGVADRPERHEDVASELHARLTDGPGS